MIGDYDGDKIIAIWQPEIVSQFKNADNCYATVPSNLKDCFAKEKETMSFLLKRIESLDREAKIKEIQRYLLGTLSNVSTVGAYSKMHDNAVYKLGYDHPDTIRLAYL